MNKQIVKMLANMLAFYIGIAIFPEVKAFSVSTVVFAGFLLWLVNILIRPVLLLITLPVNILTLGLFSLVINTWMVMLVGKLIRGLYVGGFWPAFGLALIVALANLLMEKLIISKE